MEDHWSDLQKSHLFLPAVLIGLNFTALNSIRALISLNKSSD